MKRLLGNRSRLSAASLLAGGANAALIKVGNLVLKADGGFTPRQLPRNTYEPIDFRGLADLINTDGSRPRRCRKCGSTSTATAGSTPAGCRSASRRAGRHATPAEARNRCAERDHRHRPRRRDLSPSKAQPPMPASSAMTLFNGPRQDGNPTVIGHARTTVPAVQTFVITIPIERRPRRLPLPRHLRRARRSPAAAAPHPHRRQDRPPLQLPRQRTQLRLRPLHDGVIRTHGRFLFADGTIIDGSIEKPCTRSAEPPRLRFLYLPAPGR